MGMVQPTGPEQGRHNGHVGECLSMDGARMDRPGAVRIWKATGVALLILLLGDAGYRVASARYAQLSSSVPLPPGTLNQFPMQLGEWTGRDVKLDPAIVRFTDTDDRLNRVYTRGVETITLYIAYGVRLRDLSPHRPDKCYGGAGWTLETTRTLQVASPDGASLPCEVMTFTRGVLEKELVTVLHYYLVNGQHHADVSGLRNQAAKLMGGPSYCCQVQVACGSGSPERADKLIREFTGMAAPRVRELLDRATHGAPESQPAH